MAQEGCDWAGLDAIWISHFHLDHCGGLAPYLFGTKHAPETQARTKPLRIFGGNGLRDLLERFQNVNDYGLLKQPFPLELIEIEALEKFEILDGVAAVAMKTPHTPESHAIHIRDRDDTTIVFTSDTGFHEPLAAFSRHVDLLLIECSFVKEKPVDIHLELAEAMYLIRKAAPKRALLSHLYPVWDDVDHSSVIESYQPDREVLTATDGMKIEITPA
jgi:ribonuclease Z